MHRGRAVRPNNENDHDDNDESLSQKHHLDGFVVESVPGAGVRIVALDAVAGERRAAVSLRLLPLDLDEVVGAVHHRRLAGRVHWVCSTASVVKLYTTKPSHMQDSIRTNNGLLSTRLRDFDQMSAAN